MIRLYYFLPSGNCYKVRLLLTQLGIPFQGIELNILRGETRTPEFLSKNPLGRLPVVETESGQILWESNAILCYLSEGTEFFASDRFERSQVLQWLFFEQYSLAPYIAPARFWLTILGKAEEYQNAIQQKWEPGYAALTVIEKHLSDRCFIVGDRYTIADMSLFAYTSLAPEGGFDLTDFPAIQIWLERLIAQPGHIKITQTSP